MDPGEIGKAKGAQRIRRGGMVLLVVWLVGALQGSSVWAQSMPPGPGAGSSRVEVPEAGFALAFPEGWAVALDTSEPGEFTVHPLLTATLPDGESCEVGLQDAGSWNSLNEWAGTVLLRLRDYGLLDFEAVVLPAGDAVRIDMDMPDEEETFTQYLLSEGSGFYSLACFASAPPEDRWFSIAETFEFLPGGAG